MRRNTIPSIALAVAAIALVGCSPPSRIDQTMVCGGKEYQLGRGEGREPFIVINNTLVSCQKYMTDAESTNSVITDHRNCCATIPLYLADQERKAAREALHEEMFGASDDDGGGGGHHGP